MFPYWDPTNPNITATESMKQVCPSCREDALFVTDAVYDGFRRIGETRRCTLCGHVIRDTGGRKVPPAKAASKANPLWDAFAKEDAPEASSLFDTEKETAKLCRKCAHYVVNPFTQRCMLHDREVEATDSCDQFDPV